MIEFELTTIFIIIGASILVYIGGNTSPFFDFIMMIIFLLIAIPMAQQYPEYQTSLISILVALIVFCIAIRASLYVMLKKNKSYLKIAMGIVNVAVLNTTALPLYLYT